MKKLIIGLLSLALICFSYNANGQQKGKSEKGKAKKENVAEQKSEKELKEKQKGFTYIDTHSGAGVYRLDSEQAQKTREYQSGVGRLKNINTQQTLLLQYQTLINGYLQHNQYPGSPEIAKQLIRQQDAAILMEWLNTEADNLKGNINELNIAIHHRDGFEGLKALTPPAIKRGMVLIDPPYELASEYQQVVDTVFETYKRWPTATYAIWYPLIAERDDKDGNFERAKSKSALTEKMLTSLSKGDFKNLLQVELLVEDPATAQGMYGSGMAIINAPWQVDQTISDALNEILPVIAPNNQAGSVINWLIQNS